MYIVQTVHTGLMLDVHCADCTYRTNVMYMYIVHCADCTYRTGLMLMLDVHCADCTYRNNVRCTLCRLYIQD